MATRTDGACAGIELAGVHAELVAVAGQVRAALASGDRPALAGLARRLVRLRRWAQAAGLADVARWASTLLDRALGGRAAA
jgi:hypothetical protein